MTWVARASSSSNASSPTGRPGVRCRAETAGRRAAAGSTGCRKPDRRRRSGSRRSSSVARRAKAAAPRTCQPAVRQSPRRARIVVWPGAFTGRPRPRRPGGGDRASSDPRRPAEAALGDDFHRRDGMARSQRHVPCRLRVERHPLNVAVDVVAPSRVPARARRNAVGRSGASATASRLELHRGSRSRPAPGRPARRRRTPRRRRIAGSGGRRDRACAFAGRRRARDQRQLGAVPVSSGEARKPTKRALAGRSGRGPACRRRDRPRPQRRTDAPDLQADLALDGVPASIEAELVAAGGQRPPRVVEQIDAGALAARARAGDEGEHRRNRRRGHAPQRIVDDAERPPLRVELGEQRHLRADPRRGDGARQRSSAPGTISDTKTTAPPAAPHAASPAAPGASGRRGRDMRSPRPRARSATRR